jgi:hypothetical protein
MSQHKAQQGYFTFAQNTDSVDYLRLAYLQALNIKATQKHNLFAVAVDENTRSQLNEKHLSVFDYIIDITHDYTDPTSTWKLANEWQVFWLTPFKETIKLESDLLFTRSIDHWWTSFRLRDVCLSTGCRNYLQQISNDRSYRKSFDDNHLPDVYNGLMYFRYSLIGSKFFNTAKDIFNNWEEVKQHIQGCNETTPSTDMLYALTAHVIGEDLCTLPSLDFINFVHMKPSINGFDDSQKFTDVFNTEFDNGMIRINNINQYHPLHYYTKDFATDELIEYYEQRRSVG